MEPLLGNSQWAAQARQGSARRHERPACLLAFVRLLLELCMERVQLDLEPLELNTLRLGCVRCIAERSLQSHALGVLAAMARCKMRPFGRIMQRKPNGLTRREQQRETC